MLQNDFGWFRVILADLADFVFRCFFPFFQSNQDEGVSELDGGNSSQTLVDLLQEREDTILRLETDVTKVG